MCVKSIVFLLINFHIHHYFAVNLWDIQENEGEEHTFFSPFVQKEMSSKWNRLNADLHSAAPGSTMLLLRLFSGLALCIMPHSICFLGKNKQTNTTDYMASKPHGCVSHSPGSWEVQGQGAGKFGVCWEAPSWDHHHGDKARHVDFGEVQTLGITQPQSLLFQFLRKVLVLCEKERRLWNQKDKHLK